MDKRNKMNYDEKCQLIIIGDSSVGKTSILFKYFKDNFPSNHLATVGIDFHTKDITINNKIIRIKVWDTAGQERYKSQTKSLYNGVQGIILVYDVSNKDTFLSIEEWMDGIYEKKGKDSGYAISIIGNKTDLEREISKEKAEEMCRKYEVPYFETSALNGVGISEMFNSMVIRIFSDKLVNLRLSHTSSGNNFRISAFDKQDSNDTDNDDKKKCGC